MARRKGVSKSKSSVRKTMCDNTNAVEGDDKLKDDPGGGKPQAMDEIKYLSDKKNQAEISQQNQIHENHHHHHKYNNSNNFSDLKYLHKKFKRIASATVVDNINTPVIDSRPTNSNELKLNTCSRPEHKQDVADQANEKIQLNNILEQQRQFNRQNREHVKIDETLEVSTKHKELDKTNQKQYNQQTTTLLNGFNCSNSNDSGSIEPAKNFAKFKTVDNSSTIVAKSNDKFNNFVQLDVANINISQKKSANAIVSSNCSSINSVNTTKTYLIPAETPFQQRNQEILSTSTQDNKQQSLGSYTPPIINHQSPLAGKSTFNNYPLKSPTHHYQSIGDITRTVTSVVNSISILQAPTQSKMQFQQSHVSDPSHTPGRYVCPFCQLSCTKPSVLQKHIRAHTNERPYPCDVCGFAFKTRSNLYKHCRSKAHALRMQGGEPQPDDEVSLGSDQDQDQELSSSASSDVISGTASPVEDRVSSPSSQQIEKPYKPKFHNAALYASDDQQKQKLLPQQQQQPTTSAVTSSGAISISHPLTTQNVEYLKERISKIISENESIMEVVEAPLKKKYRKITGISRGIVINENASTKLTIALLKQREESQNNANNNVTTTSVQQNNIAATVSSSPSIRSNLPTLQQQAQQVLQTSQQFSLNLTKIFETPENLRKRRFSEGIPPGQEVATHPQNPERSIIKDLLLNSRGLAIPTGEGEDAVYTCPLCKITFRSADNLQYHTKCYCQGSQASTPGSAPISPVGSPSHKYFRSNSFNVNLPEKYNPNTLAKLASSTLRHPNKTPLSLAKLAQTKIKPGRSKPENIVINKDTCPAPTPLPTQSISVQCAPIAKLIDAPLPSPGPLLGKTRLVDTYNGDRMTEEAIISHFTSERDAPAQSFIKSYSTDEKYREKRSRVDSYSMNSPVFLTSMEQLASPNSRLLQMCGGDLKIVERREETLPKFGSSGGSIISISPPSDCHTPEPFGIRSGLLSGGGVVDTDITSTKDGSGYVITPTLTPKHGPGQLTGQYFQFPPISPIITGYNPLTLPPVHATTIVHGGRIIPHVPGMPGPNSLSPRPVSPLKRIPSPTNRRMVPSPLTLTSSNAMMSSNSINTPKFTLPTTPQVHKTLALRSIPNIKIDDSDDKTKKIGRNGINESNLMSSISSIKPETKRSFNFSRIAENLSPRNDMKKVIQEPIDADIRYFNFDNVVTKPEVKASHTSPLHIDVSTSPVLQSNRVEETTVSSEPTKSTKFLRPSSLPLKPGTFTPKRHHGITPTANTLPLISPETPRPSKSCVQLYLNGHAYTYLGLKCSTKTFYCTVNRPQPVHFTNQHKLSIYSNWQICAESDPHPLGLSPKSTMSLYDSRQRPTKYTMAKPSQTCTTLHSQSLIVTPFDNNKLPSATDNLSGNRNVLTVKSDVHTSAPAVSGGYESNEVYTYVRGRGRGRYVCSECGIRCKKPSMLKKHIRTHSDVRPYTCQHCLFSFKTKGNLTKHMKSKAHYKKCVELGLTPLPPSVDDDGVDDDTEGASMTSGDHTSTVPGDSDTDDLSDGEDGENDSSDTSDSKLRLPEHEAARCLLYLSQTPPGNTSMPNLIPVRPMTYPYGDQPSQMHTQSSDVPVRRVISFQTTTPFEYSSKHDQYYSNPKISLMSQKFEDSNSMPIDLTKPRDTQQSSQQIHCSVQPNSSDVDGILKGPVGFLTTLVSNTDKVITHQVVPHMVDENVFMQTYLTERALQDSKIKQSQMYRSQQGISSTMTTSSSNALTKITIAEPENRRSAIAISSLDKSSFTINTATVVTSSSVGLNTSVHSMEKKTHPIMSTGLSSQNNPQLIIEKGSVIPQNGNSRDFDKIVSVESRFDRNEDNTSGMDTLAEIAASSVKLDITQSRIKVVDTENLNMMSGQQANSAKSVASEYLKMTSAEFMKAHQYKSDREESEESGESEDESGPIKAPEFGGVLPRKMIVGDDGFKGNNPDYNVLHPRILIQEDGRSACSICHKTFPKQHQMKLHMNIHYMERKFRCEPCAVSFRTQGHLQKHERSEQHKNKVLMTSTFGNVTTSNPRPFECSDCNIAFRIHGHLAKHLRSKTHVQKLECLQKLPFGTYAEIERAGISLTDIDTTDCHNSLASLKLLAQRLLDKDPSKLNSWSQSDEQLVRNYTNESRESNSDGEPICSPDDESISDSRTSDREISMSESNMVSVSVKRKSEMNGINELNESGVENHEKRLKVFSDT